ncbi:MAG: DUF86 domain-containing protein [Bryobacterales bacterium]|nr:DUF86 domain-containing protein [Bryobacterales bacterium]
MKEDRAYLCHVRDAIARIEKYASVGKEEFLTQSHWQDAVIRQLEILGEASKRISPALRENSPDVPWRRICGLRDVLIHNYVGVDLDAVGAIVEVSIPQLRVAVEALLRLSDASSDPGSK